MSDAKITVDWEMMQHCYAGTDMTFTEFHSKRIDLAEKLPNTRGAWIFDQFLHCYDRREQKFAYFIDGFRLCAECFQLRLCISASTRKRRENEVLAGNHVELALFYFSRKNDVASWQ